MRQNSIDNRVVENIISAFEQRKASSKRLTLDHAKDIIGNQPSWALKGMVKALSLFRILNTQEEEYRLQAAKMVLRSRRVRYSTKLGGR